jgi:hypothetical protein
MLDLLASATDLLGGSHILALASGGLSLATGGFFARKGAKLVAVLCLVVAASIASAWASHAVTHNAWMAAEADRLVAENAARDAEAKKQADASTRLEEKKEAIHVQTRTITKYVDRVVERPVYRSDCIDDDGVRLINSALTGAPAAAGQPDGAVPGPDAAGGQDRRPP